MGIKVLLIALIALILLPAYRPLAIAEEDPPKKILVLQGQTFAPYERSFQGFKRGIEESGYLGNIEVERFNAENDLKLLGMKILEIKDKKEFDLIFTLGTRATQMAIAAIDEIPIVFTDLGAAEYSGIINDWKSSGTNFTGVETPKFLTKGIYMLHQLTPFKKFGMLYLKGSPSHEGAVKQMKLVSKSLGSEFVYDGFPLKNKNDENIPDKEIRELISEKLKNILPHVDVFFVQPSKTFVDNFDLFLNGFKKYGVLSAGSPIYIERGIVVGVDQNKFLFGKQSAEYAVKIFRGTPPAQLPMDTGQSFLISFNLKAAAVVGFMPPLDLLGAADAIYQDFEESENQKKQSRFNFGF